MYVKHNKYMCVYMQDDLDIRRVHAASTEDGI